MDEPTAGEIGSDALAGEFLLRYGCVDGAAELFSRVLACDGGDGRVHARLAEALQYLDDLPAAVEHYEAAKRLLGDAGIADSNLGIVLTLQGRLDDALNAHRRALSAAPQGAVTPYSLVLIWNAAHTLLASGRLADGWDAYEARVTLGLGPANDVGLPEWGVAEADSRSVLVLSEQGVGDEVLFASCVPDLIDEAEMVCIECDPRLVPLMGRSFPTARVGPRGRWSRSGAISALSDGPESVIASGSLPRRYRRSPEDFPADGAYLLADPDRVSGWRARLGRLPPGPRIGISWRSILNGQERLREYAPLAAWAPVLVRPGAQFVSLQVGDCERELIDVERELGVTIHRWNDLDLLNDFEEVAALISALDLVVAPRNSVAHLAGALGAKTVMVANPHVWTELGTGTLPWFPAVTVVHRKPGNSWAEPIEAAARHVR
jgi:hypothetical protein